MNIPAVLLLAERVGLGLGLKKATLPALNPSGLDNAILHSLIYRHVNYAKHIHNTLLQNYNIAL